MIDRWTGRFLACAVFGAVALANIGQACAQGQCPTERCLSASGPADSGTDCHCPAGSKKVPFRIQGDEQHFEITTCGNRTIKIDLFWCEGTSAATPAPAPAPVRPTCSRAELLANFNWIHENAALTKKSAVMQGNILRSSSLLDEAGVDDIRKAYKLAQSHNPPVAALIDKCDDITVDQVAYAFAENVRLKSCGGSRPAVSATCSDYTENLRWALLDSGPCAPYSRAELDGVDWDGVSDISILRETAYFIRRGFKYAQGHARDTALSVDFISDALLVKLSRDVWDRFRVERLPRSDGIDEPDPATCPGVKLFDFWEDS